MRKYAKRETFAETGPKEHWHPYGLQSLRPEKFIVVVNAIISGRQQLLSIRRRPSGSTDEMLPERG